MGTKLVSVKTNKQTEIICIAQRGSKHNSMMNERRRQPSIGQEKKKNTLADSSYFYIEESILCTNFCALAVQFTFTLHAQS